MQSAARRDDYRGACVLGAVWFRVELPAVRSVMRPICLEMGILPGVEDQVGG